MPLSTKYLGMQLDNPLVPSASPLSQSLDMARELEDAGAAALIMHSLFEEEVRAADDEPVRFLAQNGSEPGTGLEETRALGT